MKSLIVLTLSLALVIAQRPGYLGSGPVGYPGLASRFKDDSTTSTSTTPDVANRLGENGGTQRIPIDARGDTALVNRLNQWPREHRPFWILNAEHIERQRNPQGNVPAFQNTQQQNLQGRFGENSDGYFDDFGNPIPYPSQTIRPVQTRGSFAG